MFISNLNQKQQETLLQLAKKIIAIDGIIDEKESLMIEAIKKEMHPKTNIESNHKEPLNSIFISKKEASSLLFELIGLAYADDEYHEEESRFINEIASQLNISKENLYVMENWVQRQLCLSREAIYLMEE